MGCGHLIYNRSVQSQSQFNQMKALWRLARLLPVVGVATYGSWKAVGLSQQFEDEREDPQEKSIKFRDILAKKQEIADDIKEHLLEEKESEREIGKVNEETNDLAQHPPAAENEVVNKQDMSTKAAKDSITLSEQSMQNSQPVAQKMIENQGEKKQEKVTIGVNFLQKNEVLIGKSCPSDIVRYLELAGLKVIQTDQIEEDFVIKNSRDDVWRANLSTIKSEKKDEMQMIAKFIRPPQELTIVQEAKQLLNLLLNDNFVVMAYIPYGSDYESLVQSRIASAFDTFGKSRQINIQQVEDQFVSYAYGSSSNKDNYLIVRTPEVAKYLKLNEFNIGLPYILHKTTKQSGGEANYKIEGIRYKIKEVRKEWSFDEEGDKNQINKLTHFYINRIESETDMANKVRQMQLAADGKKILLFYTQEHRQDFHAKAEDILEKVARLQKNNVVVIKTANEGAVRNILNVEPDSFATIRLIDVHGWQEPLFGGSTTQILKRYKYKGPFKVQNLCDFVLSTRWEEYYESKKKLSSIKTVQPKDLLNLNRTLVLMEKEGCEGCRYLGQSLEQLKKAIKSMRVGGKLRKQWIYRLGIENPLGLSSVSIRRYSIFNDNMNFIAPKTTPKLYWLGEGGYSDLEVEKSLSMLNEVKGGQSVEQADDIVLGDIINRIRLLSESLQEL